MDSFRYYELRNASAKVIDKLPFKKEKLSLAMIRARQLHRETGIPHYVYKINEQKIYTSRVE
jgi:hypothetical protein